MHGDRLETIKDGKPIGRHYTYLHGAPGVATISDIVQAHEERKAKRQQRQRVRVQRAN